MFICVTWLLVLCFSKFYKSDMSRWGISKYFRESRGLLSQSISESPVDFEITRVNCGSGPD